MNTPSNAYYDVVIVGAGPVGLLLGQRLNQLGLSFIILEKKDSIDPHSRAVGIHPPSLEYLDRLGLADTFMKQAVKVDHADVYLDDHKLTGISFTPCKKPFNYIALLPQSATEALLEQTLLERQPDCVVRGVKHIAFDPHQASVAVKYINAQGVSEALTADLILACDGKESAIRNGLNIAFRGTLYPDNYVMGDFSDHTAFGNKAVIFLCQAGVVESFPLPANLRRWVVKTDHFHADLAPRQLTDIIKKRTGIRVDSHSVALLNGFQTQGLIADKFYQDRILLAGDAAHVTSPIGGQGMNMGWINAWRLAEVVHDCLRKGIDREAAFKGYERRAQRIAREVIRRAEMNMVLGRKWPLQILRRLVLHLMLDTPVRYVFTRVFTMRWL